MKPAAKRGGQVGRFTRLGIVAGTPAKFEMDVYVYVLKSCKDSRLYVGIASDLKDRIRRHNLGRVRSTKKRLPLVLAHQEKCLGYKEARRKEKFFKSGQGRIAPAQILK